MRDTLSSFFGGEWPAHEYGAAPSLHAIALVSNAFSLYLWMPCQGKSTEFRYLKHHDQTITSKSALGTFHCQIDFEPVNNDLTNVHVNKIFCHLSDNLNRRTMQNDKTNPSCLFEQIDPTEVLSSWVGYLMPWKQRSADTHKWIQLF